jgi:hypothetical protein
MSAKHVLANLFEDGALLWRVAPCLRPVQDELIHTDLVIPADHVFEVLDRFPRR